MINKVEEVDENKRLLESEMKQKQHVLNVNEEHSKGLKKDIEESKTQRQMKLELLIQLQKKLYLYTEVAKGRKPSLLYKTESSLTSEYGKEKELNMKLSKVVENLLSDFPNHFHELSRALNTLKLPIFVIMPS